MTKLDPQVMNIFTKDYTSTAEEATKVRFGLSGNLIHNHFSGFLHTLKKSGINKIFPNAVIDAYLFDPCGYSVNAVLPGVSRKNSLSASFFHSLLMFRFDFRATISQSISHQKIIAPTLALRPMHR
jgi:hypothetical protein